MATANAATSFLEYKVLDFIFKNNSGSFATPGDGLYVEPWLPQYLTSMTLLVKLAPPLSPK